jgi:hypothetical protein
MEFLTEVPILPKTVASPTSSGRFVTEEKNSNTPYRNSSDYLLLVLVKDKGEWLITEYHNVAVTPECKEPQVRKVGISDKWMGRIRALATVREGRFSSMCRSVNTNRLSGSEWSMSALAIYR